MATLQELSPKEAAEIAAIQERVDATTEAYLRELLGSRNAKRDEVKTAEALVHFDRLHAPANPRHVKEVLAAAEDLVDSLNSLSESRVSQFISGVSGALLDSLNFESGGPFLQPAEHIVEHQALMEADKIRIEAGIPPLHVAEQDFVWSQLDGSIIGYEWVLGRRLTLDHRSDLRRMLPLNTHIEQGETPTQS